MKIAFGLLLLVMHSTNTAAQQDSVWYKRAKNSIQVNLGFIHTRLIDEGFTQSKLLFRGTNAKFVLGYGRETNKSIMNLRVLVSPGKIRTKQDELAASFFHFASCIEYLRKIKTLNVGGKESQFFAGLQLSTINYIIENSPIFDNVDAVSLHGIYLKLGYHLKLNKKNNLRFAYSMPMIVYGNRPLWNSGASVYTLDDTKRIIKLLTTHGRYFYFDLSRNIQADIVYVKLVGKNVDFDAGLAFTYVNNSVEKPIRMYSNQLTLGLKFRL